VLPVAQALTSDDAEKSHKLAIKALSTGLAPKDLGKDDDSLAFEVCFACVTATFQ
jgi:hypothetical protein